MPAVSHHAAVEAESSNAAGRNPRLLAPHREMAALLGVLAKAVSYKLSLGQAIGLEPTAKGDTIPTQHRLLNEGFVAGHAGGQAAAALLPRGPIVDFLFKAGR